MDSPCIEKGCSKCCRGTRMPLSNDDAKRIEELTGMMVGEFTKPLEETEGILELANNPNTKACVFLHTDSPDEGSPGTCRIHAYRPKGCQSYPIILDMEDGVFRDSLCPWREMFPAPGEIERQMLLELEGLIKREAERRG